jgi:monoamine oxidase
VKIEAMARTVPPDAPHTAPNAKVWDSETTESAIARVCFSDKVRRLLYITVRAVMGVEARDVSFLHLLTYCASSGSAEALVTIKDGNQDSTFSGGSQQL